ncbi:MAG: hypothetical protein ACM37V_08750 [Gemmatimonadota bacterium]
MRQIAAALALILGAPLPLMAQRLGGGLREVRDIGNAGINLVVAVPVGEFRQNVNVAGGLDVFGAFNLGRSGLALRLDGSYLIYGSDNQYVAYPVSITTTYSITSFGVGPQITLGQGPLRLYGFGTVGFSYIWVRSSYGADGCGCGTFASGTDFDDWTGALQGGGGLLFNLRSRHAPIALDIGARYLSNGDAWYVSPGDVVPQPNGDLVIYPVRSKANLVMLHAGVSIGLR